MKIAIFEEYSVINNLHGSEETSDEIVQSNNKNNSVITRSNQIMSELLALGNFYQLSCLQIEQLLLNCYILFVMSHVSEQLINNQLF